MANNATKARLPKPTPILAPVPNVATGIALADRRPVDDVSEEDPIEVVVGLNVIVVVVVNFSSCVVVLADCVVVLGINELVVELTIVILPFPHLAPH